MVESFALTLAVLMPSKCKLSIVIFYADESDGKTLKRSRTNCGFDVASHVPQIPKYTQVPWFAVVSVGGNIAKQRLAEILILI